MARFVRINFKKSSSSLVNWFTVFSFYCSKMKNIQNQEYYMGDDDAYEDSRDGKSFLHLFIFYLFFELYGGILPPHKWFRLVTCCHVSVFLFLAMSKC